MYITIETGLKSELVRLGTKNVVDHAPNTLTRKQMQKVKEFKADARFITRKADRSNVFVILKIEDYEIKPNEIPINSDKFLKVSKDPSDELKPELNKLIMKANQTSKEKLKKIESYFEPGHNCANPKIHKNLEKLPFCPIISQIEAVTYELSRKINEPIIPYIQRKFNVKSTYEFLSLHRENIKSGTMASIDVSDLITNVPVSTTIDIFIRYVYSHPHLPPF